VAPAVLGLRTDGGTPERVRPLLVGRTVVVTGASARIGRCLTERLTRSEPGWGVARDGQALRSLPDGAEPCVLDLRDTAAATATAEPPGRGGWCAGLVISNAGHSIHRYLADYTDRFHDVARLDGVNFAARSPSCCRCCAP